MAAVTTSSSETTPWRWGLESVPEGIVLRLSGSWRMQDGPPSPALVEAEWGDRPPPRRLAFDAREVTAWDSGFLVFVLKLVEAGTGRGRAGARHEAPSGGAALPRARRAGGHRRGVGRARNGHLRRRGVAGARP